MRRAVFLSWGLFLSLGEVCFAAPSISGGSGTVGDGNSYTLTGTGFGTHALSKPTVFANFNNTNDPNSTLGSASAWDVRENMSFSVTNPKEGTHSLRLDDAWAGDIARVRTDWDQPAGAKIYIGLWRLNTHTYASDDNWKFLRDWRSSGGGNFPNWYHGQSPGNWLNAYCEDCPVDTHRFDTGDYIRPSSTWRYDEYLIQINSATGVPDGSVRIYQAGNVTVSSMTYAFNCTGATANLHEISIQDDPSNMTPTGTVAYDLISLSTGGWSRVYLSTASDCVAGERYYQPFSSWSDTSITFTQEHGSMSGTIYACVVDNSNVFSNGHEIGSGGGGGGSSPYKIAIRGAIGKFIGAFKFK